VEQHKPLEALIKAKAAEIGFADCGIARADAAPKTAERLRQWLEEGRHGSMIWMEERAHHRERPTGLWPEVRSVIALGMSYAPAPIRWRWPEKARSGGSRSMRRAATITT
jgi:epoxyqueuosine reductase